MTFAWVCLATSEDPRWQSAAAQTKFMMPNAGQKDHRPRTKERAGNNIPV
jgi:hypothetical protein